LVGRTLRDAVQPVAAGLTIGAAGGVALAAMFQSLLLGLGPVSVPVLLVVAVLVSGVAVSAVLQPALRAARIDPVGSLRAE
jgi:ABC-type antimicrobial peptide transport system permease subunit